MFFVFPGSVWNSDCLKGMLPNLALDVWQNPYKRGTPHSFLWEGVQSINQSNKQTRRNPEIGSIFANNAWFPYQDSACNFDVYLSVVKIKHIVQKLNKKRLNLLVLISTINLKVRSV